MTALPDKSQRDIYEDNSDVEQFFFCYFHQELRREKVNCTICRALQRI